MADRRRVSRRALLTAGAAVTAAGAAAVADGVVTWRLPGRAWLARLDGWCGTAVPPPVVAAGPMSTYRFASRYRRRTVRAVVAWPPGHMPGDRLPVAVLLHGAPGDARTPFEALRVHEYLAVAVLRHGVPPFAVASVDGGARYWHPRAGGDDPQGMVIHELLPRLERLGLHAGAGDRVGIMGWSMGGYGALLLAETLPATRVAAVVAQSPAVPTAYAPGSFDGPADFRRHDVMGRLDRLRGRPVWVSAGRDDPVVPVARLIRARLGDPPGGITAGCHDARNWCRRLPAELAFLGTHLRR